MLEINVSESFKSQIFQGGWGGEKQALESLIKATWANTCFATSHPFNSLLSSYYTSTSFSNDNLGFLYRN